MRRLNLRMLMLKKRICFTTLFLLLAAARCSAAAWEGTDDFSSGISVANWTVYNQYVGQMGVVVTNGHASFLAPATTTSEQNAILIWKGQPTVTNDWSIEITGHNSADWSTNGSSQFEFAFYDTASLQTSLRGYGFSMARGRHDSPIPQVRVGTSFAERTNTPAPSPDFAVRMVYSSTSKNIKAWWDENGNGSAWRPLDTISLEDVSPGMGTVATNSFTFVIQPSTYYGPITEGQLWADNFRIMSSAPSPPQLVVAGAQWSAGSEELRLTWTNNGSSFVLEGAGVATGGWSTVVTPWITNADWVSTIVSNSSLAQFYRLRSN